MNRTVQLTLWLCLLLSALTAPAQAQVTVLHSFTGGAGDGANPWGSLIQSGSILYGMTPYGGTSSRGTIFQIGADGTDFHLVHTFAGYPSEGYSPFGSLLQSGSTLFGMTYQYGGAYAGTVFKIGADGNAFTLLHPFTNGLANGGYPYGSLIQSGSTLYGLTAEGGNRGRGTIYKLGVDGTGFGLLHSFTGDVTDGNAPHGSLIQSGTTLFGTTHWGGSSDAGTIFKIQSDGSGYSVLHSFFGSPGSGSLGSLVQSGASLYGMTQGGGIHGSGSIFKINADGTGFGLLHSFVSSPNDGILPWGSLIESGSMLYGLTRRGGINDLGTVFQIGVDGSGFKLLHSFAGGPNDGSSPYGSLILSGSTLYGMTYEGGSSNQGTIFSLVIPEPSTLLLLCIGSLALLWRRRVR